MTGASVEQGNGGGTVEVCVLAVSEIEFKDVVMGYRVGLPDVLKGASFKVNAGEKIGVCGRTAPARALYYRPFRLVELRGGSVVIDGIDISSVLTLITIAVRSYRKIRSSLLSH